MWLFDVFWMKKLKKEMMQVPTTALPPWPRTRDLAENNVRISKRFLLSRLHLKIISSHPNSGSQTAAHFIEQFVWSIKIKKNRKVVGGFTMCYLLFCKNSRSSRSAEVPPPTSPSHPPWRRSWRRAPGPCRRSWRATKEAPCAVGFDNGPFGMLTYFILFYSMTFL